MAAVAYSSNNWAARIVPSRASEAVEPWVDLDRQLRTIARRRAALDHEELTLIREALRVQLWRRLGMTSMREYMETVLGHSPHVASERLRVAEALDALPAMDEALATAQLSYSAVRELTRIATRKTDEAWVAAATGKNLRQIEELVAEREPGDAPSDKPKPDVRPTRISMTLRPAARAVLRSTRHAIESARGERIDDSDLIDELCRVYLAAAAAGEAERDGDETGASVPAKTARSAPRAQIAITRCEGCNQAWQHAAGRTIAITEAEYETAACDAVMIGSLDGAPSRASSTIPPRTRRQILHRDGYRCTVPGCRAAANIDVHHIIHREHGGGNEPENLTSMCSGHHQAHHRGELLIEGPAPAITVTWRFRPSHVGLTDVPTPATDRDPAASSHVGLLAMTPRRQAEPHVIERNRDALRALTALGFRKSQANAAIEHALTNLTDDASLEVLLKAALRECPR